MKTSAWRKNEIHGYVGVAVAALSLGATPAFASGAQSAAPTASGEAASDLVRKETPVGESASASLLQAQRTASSWTELPVAEASRLVAENLASLKTTSGLALNYGADLAWEIPGDQVLLRVPIASGRGSVAVRSPTA